MSQQSFSILFLTYQGDLAGSTNSIAYLAKGLAERGHHVCVGIRQESLLWGLLDDSKVIRIPMTFKGKFDLENWRQIRDTVRDHKIQIINPQSSHDRYTAIFANWRYKLGVQIVHTRRQNPLSAGGWLQRQFYIKNTANIVVISEGLKRIFIEKGYPASHLKVIHNGIPTSRFEQWSPERVEDLRTQLQLTPETAVIGCVSRIKEQEQLIRAVYEMDNAEPTLVFAGVIEAQLRPFLDKYPLKNKIHILGDLLPEDILNLYRLFTVDVLPSSMDGFGLVILEAMAMNCPVIASNFGGIPDLIEDGVNGFLFDNHDIETLKNKLQQVLNDGALREQFISNGKKTVFEKFTMEKTTANYETYFKSLVDNK